MTPCRQRRHLRNLKMAAFAAWHRTGSGKSLRNFQKHADRLAGMRTERRLRGLVVKAARKMIGEALQ